MATQVTVSGEAIGDRMRDEALTIALQDMGDPSVTRIALVRQANGKWAVVTQLHH